MAWELPPMALGRIEPQGEIEGIGEIGTCASSLDFLRAVYSDPGQPMNTRMRAAIAALPFEHPKLAVTASIDGGPGFAAKLEEAIIRSRKVIEHEGEIAETKS